MSVYLAPSIWRSVDPRTMSAVLASITTNPTNEHVIFEPLWNDALIARSRSLLATKFLETDADVMAIFDDDIVWNPEDFWKLIEGARETRSIYCGPYVTRSDKPHLASRMYPDTNVAIYASPNRRPVEIEYAATGFTAIHRDVFEAMLTGEFRDADGTHRIHQVTKGGGVPFYPFFATFTLEDREGAYHYLSEDWAFSERARQLGFQVWMDQSIVLQHMGWYPFTVEDLKRHDSPYPSTGTDVVEVAGAEPTGEPLLDTLIEDIAEWAEESVGDTRRMVAAGTALLARLWEGHEESEGEWYQREDVGMAYVGDLASWHLRGGCPIPLAEMLAGKRVLDYGAGIGTFALAAARAGAEVYIREPNPVLREFAHWRAGRRGLHLERDRWDAPAYDVAVCWHVFEHLEHPEAALWDIASHLKMGGALITQSDFHCDGEHPMHHERDDWEDVLTRYGFRARGDNVYELVREAVTV